MSDKLQEIFKDRPDLLETKEVKELVEYVKNQHARQINLVSTFRDPLNKITDLVFNSEVIVINGNKAKEVLLKIHEIL